MTTVLDETRPMTSDADDQGPPVEETSLPDASVLDDKTPVWFRMPAVSAIFTVVIGLIFLQMAFRPLWHTDLWDHLNYGQQILRTGTLSQSEPLLLLAKGVPMTNFPWLAQLAMAWTFEQAGLAALQFAAALCVAMMMAVVAWRATRKGGSAYAGLIAIAVFMALNRFQFMVVRPQLLGVLFYTITLAWCTANRRQHWAVWAGMFGMFAVWANCHGSFSIGLLLMALTGAGRFVDVALRSRSLKAALLDRRFVQTVLLTQLCATAVLLNPAGLAIYREVLLVSSNPNIQSMYEWFPMTLRSSQGQWAAVTTLMLMILIRLTPRRLRLAEMLPLLCMGLLAAWSSRMVNWWAPLMGLAVGVHSTAVVRQLLHKKRRTTPYAARGFWTVANLGICWILFAFTHFGTQVVHGRVPEPERLVSDQTPVQLVQYLNTKEDWPDGIALVPAEWAGYVMNSGPKSINPMVNLHVHVIPPEVWADYEKVCMGLSDWESILDQYGINMVIVDKEMQPRLLRKLTESSNWTPRYQDRHGVVLTRNNPI